MFYPQDRELTDDEEIVNSKFLKREMRKLQYEGYRLDNQNNPQQKEQPVNENTQNTTRD